MTSMTRQIYDIIMEIDDKQVLRSSQILVKIAARIEDMKLDGEFQRLKCSFHRSQGTNRENGLVPRATSSAKTNVCFTALFAEFHVNSQYWESLSGLSFFRVP